MRKQFLTMCLKAAVALLTLSLMFVAVPMPVTVQAEEDETPAVTVVTGKDYTDYTYSLKAGKLGNSTPYSDRSQFRENDTDRAFNISAGKGGAVTYTFPIYSTIRSISLTADVEKGYGIEVSCDGTNWTSVLDDRYVNARNRNLKITMPDEANFSGDSLYIRFEFAGCVQEDGTEFSKWYDGYLYGLDLTIRYDEVLSVEEETDGYGATVTTLKKGTDHTDMIYSMTCGTAGTSGGYCVSIGSDGSDGSDGSESKAREDAYCGGKGTGGVIFEFPILFAGNVETVSLSATLANRYGVDISLDNVNWTEIVPDNENKGQAIVSLNLSEIVKNGLAEQSADNLYIRFYHDEDWNAPLVYSLSVKVGYSCQGTVRTVTDAYGATVRTLTKGTDYTEMRYSMTCGTAGTSGGYCVSIGSEGKVREDAYCGGKGTGGVVYQFPILFGENFESMSLLVTLAYKYGIDISLDNVNWIEMVPDNDNNGQTTVSLDLSDAVKNALAEQDSDNLYIRFYHEEDWNAPLVYRLSVKVGYSCQGSVQTVTDEYGASVLTVTTDRYSKVVTSFTAVTGDANYYISEYNGVEIGFAEPVRNDRNQYVTDWGRMVIYGYQIDNPACLEELWWEANISQQVLLEVTTDKKISAATDLGIYKEGSDAIWTTVYRYHSETDGVEDPGLPETRFRYNLAEYADIDSSVSMIYVRISDAYYNNGWGGKFGGVVSATAWYDFGTDGELTVSEDTVKEILYGQGSIDPEEWLVCRYTVARTGEQKERPVDSSYVDIEWTNTETGRNLGSRTPTAPGTYSVTVTPNSDWAMRFRVGTLTVSGFIIDCDHSLTGYDCNGQEHWLKCDGCGKIIEGSLEAHTREDGMWQWSGTEHWFCCKCGSYDFEYGEHRFGEWQHDMLKHWQTCGDCGYTVESSLHEWDNGVITTEPTVDANGIKTFTCRTCGYTKTQKVDKLTEPDTAETKPSDPSQTEPNDTEEPKAPDAGCGCASSFTASACIAGLVPAAGILLIRKKRRRDADR